MLRIVFTELRRQHRKDRGEYEEFGGRGRGGIGCPLKRVCILVRCGLLGLARFRASLAVKEFAGHIEGA